MTASEPDSVLLAGKVAVVTGGTRGIGYATAQTFSRHGAVVIATGRSAGPLARLSSGEADGFYTATCDISVERDVETLFSEVVSQFGGVDILVNNAGVIGDGMIHRGTVESFRETIAVNLVGTWLCTRSMLQHRRARDSVGSVVNVSSIASKAGNLGQAGYASSKAGVEALTRVAAREGARCGTRVNAIRPGLIKTDMTQDMTEEWWQDKLATIPMARAGLPIEVANAALFLASDLSSYVTGAIVDVAGGREM